MYDLMHSLTADSMRSVGGFEGELVLCATIVLILLLRIPRLTSRIDSFYVMLVGSAVALYMAGPWHPVEQPSQLFTGLLINDTFTVYFRTLLLFFAVLFAIFTRISGVPDRDAAPDVYALVLGATLGMCIMASANNALMIFLGVEMASVPSYALAGLLKGRRQSSEAAIKYAVYGAGTAGIMLYGISLLCGVLGSAHIPTMGVRLAELLQPANLEAGVGLDTHMVLALGGLMVMVGLAFKLSAVPFHFWCPDVFEGASAEVNAFLSVASKAAALALLARVAIGFGYIAPPIETQAEEQVALFNVADEPAQQPETKEQEAKPPAEEEEVLLVEEPSGSAAAFSPLADRAEQIAALAPARDYLAWVLAFMAMITCTFGNLAAYGQTNIKRLLAYSTIAQAGYMMMPVPAAMVLAGSNPAAAQGAIQAMVFYAGAYLFMNLGAFAIVAFLRNVLLSEEIEDYAGLIRRAPITVICFSLILVSLIGIPPLAGFVGKFQIFSALVQAKLWIVLLVAGLNTAISLYYYLRVVKTMTIDPEPETRRPVSMSFIPGTYVVLVSVPLLILGIWPESLNALARMATGQLF
ncbi:MAG: NADH-quinone oxidoreductase subunit N [Planctomycetota bacterium]|nr:MAG: NADH-quinone oxidoreductase subunit N [Planctomycetota bacterium]